MRRGEGGSNWEEGNRGKGEEEQREGGRRGGTGVGEGELREGAAPWRTTGLLSGSGPDA